MARSDKDAHRTRAINKRAATLLPPSILVYAAAAGQRRQGTNLHGISRNQGAPQNRRNFGKVLFYRFSGRGEAGGDPEQNREPRGARKRDQTGGRKSLPGAGLGGDHCCY